MKYIQQSLLLIGCILGLAACSDDDSLAIAHLTIATPTFANVSFNTATLSTTITGESSSAIIKKGFCYSTAANPDIYATTIEWRGTDNNLSSVLTGLSQNTTYYVKAFATVYNAEPVYSTEVSFITSTESQDDLLAKYEAPTYLDNYTSIAAWSQRAQWNLSNVHDPSVMKADDGYYYMYQTDASYGNAHDGHGHFHARRSKDLVNWEYMGATMEQTPAWVKTTLNEMRAEMGLAPIDNPSFGYWAPVARKVSAGKYRMYYSIVIDNYIKTGAANTLANFDGSWTERAFIGMMETTDPASNIWVDKGYVVCSSSDKEQNWLRPLTSNWDAYFKWNAIDPSYIIDKQGEHWLIYGSWHSGIVALQLNGETGKPLKELGKPWDVNALPNYGELIYTRNSRWQASEAPEIIYNPTTDYYYLFMAYDELSVAYNTRVCRSRSISGPYVGIDGANVTAGGDIYPVVTHPYKFNNSDGWVGIAHCAIFDDGAGNWFYSSQARYPKDVPGINASNALMVGHVRSIRWTTSGWPVVMPQRYGAVPQATIRESEIVGDWEHIDLSYSFATQKRSSKMTFGADHKITTGTWQGGTWSYDAQNQILTANGVELCLQREVDWEATPRTHTLVYAGYNGKKTYWGKRAK